MAVLQSVLLVQFIEPEILIKPSYIKIYIYKYNNNWDFSFQTKQEKIIYKQEMFPTNL